MVVVPPGPAGLKFWRPDDRSATLGVSIASEAGSYLLTGPSTTILTYVPATWNSADKTASVTLSNSDRTATLSVSATAGARSVRKNANGAAGKYYAEFLVNLAGSAFRVGVSDTTLNIGNTNGAVYVSRIGQVSFGATVLGTAWTPTAVANDVISLAWDTGAERIWFRLNNGNWNNNASNNPATGVGGFDASGALSNNHALWMLGATTGDSSTLRANVEALTQANLPSGFTSWMGESLFALVNKTLTVDGGSYQLTGTDTSLTVGSALVPKTLPADSGSYSLAGAATTNLLLRRSAIATAASYALTGADAALIKRVNKILTAGTASYAVAGTSASPLHKWTVAAVGGTYALAGTDALLTKLANKSLAAGSANYALTGAATPVLHRWKPVAAAGSYSLTGGDIGIRHVRMVAAVAGAYALAGTAVSLPHTWKLLAASDAYALTGSLADLKKIAGQFVSAASGSYTLSGGAASWLRTCRLAADAGSYVLSGTAATLSHFVGQIEIGGGQFRYPWLGAEDGYADGAVIVVSVNLVAGRATGASSAAEQEIVVGLRWVDGIVAGNATVQGSIRVSGISLRTGVAGGEINMSEDELLILAEAA